MSHVLWARTLTPPPGEPRDRVYDLYGDSFVVPCTLAFPEKDEELVALPDGRAYRSLSRAGLLLMAAGLPAREHIAGWLAEDPFTVGIYCAIENGPNDYRSAKKMAHTPPQEFASHYKALRSPKDYFKMLANVPPSQLGIFLGAMGPLYTYTHSRLACRHALEQAETDLACGAVRSALVCATFALNDPLVVMRTRRGLPRTTLLSEGAVCLLLVADDVRTDWSWLPCRAASTSYGVATDLMMVALGATAAASERSLDRADLILEPVGESADVSATV